MSDESLSDRYELSDQLGAGGMATVFLGRDRVLGRTVAVKTLLAQFSGDPHFIERFRREAQSAAALNHPNVVSVYDTGADNGTHYIVMEYVEGRTLRDVVREEGPLLPERVAEIGADVCAGLAFAHAHGIVHRDVKPANIMVTPNGGVKVTDFGIARAMAGESVTQTAMVLGTAQYFSPEQAQGQPVDARSDVYSLGVVLYEMLTRQVPFTGSSPVAIAYKHVKEAPIPPSRLNPDVPTALESIVMKALAKNPANRYQSATDMREDLLRALHGRPVEATPVMTDATGMIDALSDETVIIERRPGAAGYGPAVRTEDQQRRRTGIILLSVITLLIIGVAAWALSGLIKSGATFEVPNVVGLKAGTAAETLKKRGFDVSYGDAIFDEKIAQGSVARQNPAPGTKIGKGETVTLQLSSGPQFVEVPKIVGLTEAAAKRAITKAGLKVGEITRVRTTAASYGKVFSQDPSATANVKKGTPVNFSVASGRPVAEVPDVIGDLESDAINALEARGFDVQVIREDQSIDACNQEIGRVCRQDPGPGTDSEEGSTVTIVVARLAEEASPTPTPTPSVTPLPTESPSP